MALAASVRAELRGQQTNVLDLGTGAFNFALDFLQSYTDGVAAGMVNQVYTATRTLAASATEDLDMSGVLVNAFGAVITSARIKAIMVTAAAGNTNNVIVGAAATNPFVGPLGGTTPTVSVAPGGVYLVARPDATGWVVTPATGDLLKIANSAAGTSVTYTIGVLFGIT